MVKFELPIQKDECLLVLIDGEFVKFEACSYPGQYVSPEGYCRIINDTGKRCECNVIHTLRDGSCPCAPHQKAPLCKREAK